MIYFKKKAVNLDKNNFDEFVISKLNKETLASDVIKKIKQEKIDFSSVNINKISASLSDFSDLIDANDLNDAEIVYFLTVVKESFQAFLNKKND